MKIPEEWQLVPIEPTPEMVARGLNNWMRNTRSLMFSTGDVYKAMLAAAPTPPVQEDEPVAYAAKNFSTGQWGNIWYEKDVIQRWINLQHQSRDDVTYVGPIPLYTHSADPLLVGDSDE